MIKLGLRVRFFLYSNTLIVVTMILVAVLGAMYQRRILFDAIIGRGRGIVVEPDPSAAIVVDLEARVKARPVGQQVLHPLQLHEAACIAHGERNRVFHELKQGGVILAVPLVSFGRDGDRPDGLAADPQREYERGITRKFGKEPKRRARYRRRIVD